MAPFPFPSRSALALGAFCSLLSASAPAAPAIDLAAPGQGFERWQWACSPDARAGEPLGRSVQRQAPFELRRGAPGSSPRWAWTGETPFEAALVKSARGDITPAAAGVSYRKADGLPHLRLEVDFQEGALWRGIPVQGFASHHAPAGSYAYFLTPLAREQVLSRLAANPPRSPALWAAYLDEQRANPLPASIEASLRKISASRTAPGPSATASAREAAFFRDFHAIRQAPASEIPQGDKPAPGLVKIGCFDGAGHLHGLSRLEIR